MTPSKDTISGMTGDQRKLSSVQELGAKLKAFSKTLREVMYGLPLLPPYYSIRLLPYIIPTFNMWKRRILRERDLTEQMAADL